MVNKPVDVHLSIDVQTKLQISMKNINARLESEFVGLANSRCIIATCPDDDISEVLSRAIVLDNPVVVRYIHDGKIFGFQSEIIGSISEPARLIFMNYPKIVEKLDLRRQKRLSCLLPAKITIVCKTGDTSAFEALSGTIVDITTSGCRFKTKLKHFSSKDMLSGLNDAEIEFLLPGVGDSLSIRSGIKSLADKDEFALLGVQFLSISEKNKRYLDGFIEKQVSYET